MLQWMRRPEVRALQRRSIGWLPTRWQVRARRDLRRQNRFALRYGRRIVTASIWIVVASLSFQLAYAIVLELSLRGAFTIPSPPAP